MSDLARSARATRGLNESDHAKRVTDVCTLCLGLNVYKCVSDRAYINHAENLAYVAISMEYFARVGSYLLADVFCIHQNRQTNERNLQLKQILYTQRLT